MPDELVALPDKNEHQVGEDSTENQQATVSDDLVLNVLDEQVKQVKEDLAWHDVIPQLKLGGRAAEIVKHCLLVGSVDKSGLISLTLDASNATLLSESVEAEISSALSAFYKHTVKLDLTVSVTVEEESLSTKPSSSLLASSHSSPLSKEGQENNLAETPAQRTARNAAEVQIQAEKNIVSDPFVVELQNRFGAKIVPNSIKPKNSNSTKKGTENV